MKFFSSKKNYDEWASGQTLDEETTFCLTVKEALVVAKMLFSE